ncbi:hypothetical protein ABMA27_010775 [Loxostege sticticalis]|uniref:Transposase Tc1-like domain-containing protein n=1 Tax=Loxostege sticticalis TaxID=481309 RepID=A0ABR3H4D5_LOXSC
MPLTPAQVAQAVALINQGLTQREVATVLNVPRSSMQYALKRYQDTGRYTRRSGSGGVRCTSARDDRFIVLEILRNRFLTAVEIRQRLQIARGVNVSKRTIRRRMEEVNLRATYTTSHSWAQASPQLWRVLGQTQLRGPSADWWRCCKASD